MSGPIDVLYDDGRFAVTDYRCVARRGEKGAEEVVSAYEIVFVRRGLFRVSMAGQRFVATRNEMLLFSPGDVYRIDHPVAGGDACTVISLSRAMAANLFETCGIGSTSPSNPFLASRALSDGTAYVKHLSLLRALRRGADSVIVESLVSDIAVSVIGPHSTVCRGTSNIERIQEVLAAHSHRRLTLTNLAGLANLSPFHLSRSFKAATGLSLHQYLVRLRLREALYRLEEGESDLTRLALDVGYSNHAHFTTSFRQEYGIAPSHYRAVARRQTSAR